MINPVTLDELTYLRQRVAALEKASLIRKLNDAALVESRDLFQAFMNNSPALASMKDEDGKYVYVNRQIENVLGGHPIDWWGKTDWDLFPDEVAREMSEHDREALKRNKCCEFSETIPQGDGDHHWIVFKFPFRTAAGRLYLASIALDITDRTRIEAERTELLARERAARQDAEHALSALRRSETRASRLFSSSIIGIVEIDSEHILEANDSFLKMLGFSREHVAQRLLCWKEITPERFHSADRSAVDRLLTTGVCPPYEKELLRSDGQNVPVLVGGALLTAMPCICVCFVLDLTTRKQLESRLLHAQKMESLDLLAGAVAHDFNNLLVAIMGNASLSMDALDPTHTAYETLEEVLCASRVASDLTQQLLAYSGRGKRVRKAISLTRLVREIGSLVEVSISKKVDLRMQLSDDLPDIEADPAQIQQVVMNLVINASDALGENEGLLSVITRAWDVREDSGTLFTEEVVLPGRYVYLEVCDTGCGMSPETRARIFDPLFTTKSNGRGLGLSAVQGIVSRHGGYLHVDSVVGFGTTFKILFPAGAEPALPPPAAPLADAESDLRGSGVILIVDDEPAVQKMSQVTLERYGYSVVVAQNGAEAVKIFERSAGDIAAVLLDLSMPVMDGEEALRKIAAIRPATPVLLTSGYDESESMLRIAGVGRTSFIQKPYTASELGAQIKKILV